MCSKSPLSILKRFLPVKFESKLSHSGINIKSIRKVCLYLTGAVCCFSGLNFCFIVLSLPLCWYACFKITRFIHHANHIKDDYLRYLTISVMIYSINHYQSRRAVNQRSDNSIYLSGGKRVSDLFKYRSLFSFYER